MGQSDRSVKPNAEGKDTWRCDCTVPHAFMKCTEVNFILPPSKLRLRSYFLNIFAVLKYFTKLLNIKQCPPVYDLNSFC